MPKRRRTEKSAQPVESTVHSKTEIRKRPTKLPQFHPIDASEDVPQALPNDAENEASNDTNGVSYPMGIQYIAPQLEQKVKRLIETHTERRQAVHDDARARRQAIHDRLAKLRGSLPFFRALRLDSDRLLETLALAPVTRVAPGTMVSLPTIPPGLPHYGEVSTFLARYPHETMQQRVGELAEEVGEAAWEAMGAHIALARWVAGHTSG
ncbi:hypothetical protein J8273_1173 [Carpediemonas membranifera]|uniref:Uncharacterized protein n=1 Tax=Carpediemonas membranifera TaxID=201153 RepID=A0A8J6AYM0_9EUKA|nr:hypothetical protein J8273_1173 [Carpediemonas membranifera]|eukprot:KAG9397258.1 hypothetical protein J8273_1173 [Carpediemonas membranifera]